MSVFRHKRLVIFGCGYVGSAVARRAFEEGAKVTGLTRNSDTARALRGEGIEVIEADMADYDWHARIPAEADLVLNCVAGGGTPEGYQRSYIRGMGSVLAWARRSRPRTLVYTSSTSVYPQGGGVEVDESMPATGGERATGRILATAEELLRQSSLGQHDDDRWFILRLAGIYGPGRHHLLDRIRAGDTTLPGQGTHRLNLIHREDIVSAIQAAFATPPHLGNEIFNVADDAPAPKLEVVRWLAAQVGRPAPEFSGTEGNGSRNVPDRIILNRRIKDTLGWRPAFPSYREGYAGILGPPPPAPATP